MRISDWSSDVCSSDLGGYYEHSKRESFTVGRGGFGLPVPFDPAIGNSSVGYWPDDFVYSNTYSAFGPVLWDIVDGVQLSGGVRYPQETKRADQIGRAQSRERGCQYG